MKKFKIIIKKTFLKLHRIWKSFLIFIISNDKYDYSIYFDIIDFNNL